MTTDHEISHGRDIAWTLRAKQAPEHIREAWVGTSWIVEVTATGRRDGKPFQAAHLFLTSLRTTAQALLQLVRDRWNMEGWHWIRDTQLHEGAHRSAQPAAAGWIPLNPRRHAGGGARHHGTAGNGQAEAQASAMLRL